MFKPQSTTNQIDAKEKLGQDIFSALKSQNPENFKPYIFTLEDIKNSSLKPEIKNKIINELETDPKKSKSEWYGQKSDVKSLVEEYELATDKGVELEEIELEEKEKDSKEVGVEVYEAKLHLKIGGVSGYYFRFTIANLSESWKVVDFRGNIVNLNSSADEEAEEVEEVVIENNEAEEAEEAEGDN